MKVRWSWFSLPLLTAIAACNSILGFDDLRKVEGSSTDDGGTETTPTSVPTTTTAPTTTATTTPGATCKGATPWGAPVALAAVINTTDAERNPTLTGDELTIFFERSTSQGAVGTLFS